MAFIYEDRDVDFVEIFNRMFEEEQIIKDSSDVVFKFEDGSVLCAHRIILCSRCEFYKAMMARSWIESIQPPPYEVEEESDPILFKEFIRYLYCGKVHMKNVEDLIPLYSIAEEKCHSSLLIWLNKTISEYTTTESACKMLQMLYNTCDQSTECFKNTYNGIKHVILSDINSLEGERICELEMELLISVLKNQQYKEQSKLFEAVMVWVNNCTTLPTDWRIRIFYLEPLMATIDYKSIKTWYFNDNIVPLKVLSPAIFSNIIFRIDVEAASKSVQQISDAKWRCIIPFNVSETCEGLAFKYQSRQFSIGYSQGSEKDYLLLTLKNYGHYERIKCNFTMLCTYLNNKLYDNFELIFTNKHYSLGIDKAFKKKLSEMKEEGYVFDKYLVIEMEMEIMQP
ncbi:inhibitor of tyrosine kinase [Acrasis kona]|uniref:Inhibitor of tyrosine kinase n=1 Tax=Acrasis kona TaxID=1008807 RepID=A0AAW2ZQS1_9EUKA